MLTAVIISKNEARFIGACVQALSQVCNEIIVVDSGSTDHTVAIAQSAGAKVITYEWKGYGATKNFGNSLAKNPWIISVDADEILSSELIANIKKLKLDHSCFYSLDRIAFYENKWIKHSGWYPDRVIRIFPKDTLWDDKKVHEKLIIPKGIKIIPIQGRLCHYSYISKEDHLARIKKYAHLSAEELFSKGKNISWIKRAFGPSFRFVKAYIIKLGFLDGKAGYQIAQLDAELIRMCIQHFDYLTKNK